MNKDEYLSPDYCLHCAYFTATKGHYGNCNIIPSKAYDGTRKDASCSCWRIKTEKIIPFITHILKKELPTPVRGIPESRVYPINSIGINKVMGYVGGFKYHYDIIERAVTLFSDGKNTTEINNYLKEYADLTVDRKTLREWIFKLLGIDAWNESHKKESIPCIYCKSLNTVKNGSNREQKRYKCKDCKKNFYQ